MVSHSLKAGGQVQKIRQGSALGILEEPFGQPHRPRRFGSDLGRQLQHPSKQLVRLTQARVSRRSSTRAVPVRALRTSSRMKVIVATLPCISSADSFRTGFSISVFSRNSYDSTVCSVQNVPLTLRPCQHKIKHIFVSSIFCLTGQCKQ